MRLTSAQVERTLSQFDAHAIPEDHPAVDELSDMFGNHTFFLDGSGLSVVEPVEPAETSTETGQVINLAEWSDETLTSLAPHPPVTTDVVVILGRTH